MLKKPTCDDIAPLRQENAVVLVFEAKLKIEYFMLLLKNRNFRHSFCQQLIYILNDFQVFLSWLFIFVLQNPR